ncbi:uncharacterized protein TM35_000042520 [Trypanosoma theileri]|uniref:Uncharacterized protein n=1 Tax=Trypanosoma theileri TaxID=67003 RepID=A0A1X0P5C2_9TRYP|nr:uncharacterized protein TM35_000042520 [Trypanosoma theileri]ORC92038.1 hypothetical protein TM35_000042520 [Trypanosoma theileri]
MDHSDDGIVEDVDDFLPGSPMAHRGPTMRVCRLPPPRPEGRQKPADVVPDVGAGHLDIRHTSGIQEAPTLNGDDDGFIMSPRLRKKKEEAKLKKLAANGVTNAGAKGGGRTSLGGSSTALGTTGNVSKPISNTGAVGQGKKEEKPLGAIVKPLSQLPEQKGEDKEDRRYSNTMWNEFCRTGYDPLLGRGFSIVDAKPLTKANIDAKPLTKANNVQPKKSIDIPIHEEASAVSEDIDDFLPGSPLKRDLRAPLPRHDRKPPKVGGKVNKCATLPSLLIPDFTLPGSTLNDTVDASPHPTETRSLFQERTNKDPIMPRNTSSAGAEKHSGLSGHSDAMPKENFPRQTYRRPNHRSSMAQNRRESVTRMCHVPNPNSSGSLAPHPIRNRRESMRRSLNSTRSDVSGTTTGGVNGKIITGSENTNGQHRINPTNIKKSDVTNDYEDHLNLISPRLRQKVEERRMAENESKQNPEFKGTKLPRTRRVQRQSFLYDDYDGENGVDVPQRRGLNNDGGEKLFPAINRGPVVR